MTDSITVQPYPYIRAPYTRDRVQTPQDTTTFTVQSFSGSPSEIVERYDRTGELPRNTKNPQYADVSELNQDLTTLKNAMDDTIDTFNDFQMSWEQKQQEEAKTPQEAPEPSTTETPTEPTT